MASGLVGNHFESSGFYLKLAKKSSIAEDSTKIPNHYLLAGQTRNTSITSVTVPLSPEVANPFMQFRAENRKLDRLLEGMKEKRRSLSKQPQARGDTGVDKMYIGLPFIRPGLHAQQRDDQLSRTCTSQNESDPLKRKHILKLRPIEKLSTSPCVASPKPIVIWKKQLTEGKPDMKKFCQFVKLSDSVSELTVDRDYVSSWDTKST